MGSRGPKRVAAWTGFVLAGLVGCAGTTPLARVTGSQFATGRPPAAAQPHALTPSKPEPRPAQPAATQAVVQAVAQDPAVPVPPPPPPAAELPLPAPAVPGPGCPPGGPLDAPLANLLPAPTAAGCLLNLGPHESAVERTVELAKRLGLAEAENHALAARVQHLEAAVAARDRMLFDSGREVEQAAAETAAARDDLRALRKELVAVSGRLRQVEKADADSLRAILASLEKLLDDPLRGSSAGPKVPGP
jgi:hypothetical protein